MLIIILTILIGLFLSLITLPIGYYAPEWILLIAIYWAIAIPSNGKITLAFISGIVVDIVYGQILGISSLFYVVLIYLILRLYNSLRYMTIAQQAVVLFILIFINLYLQVKKILHLLLQLFLDFKDLKKLCPILLLSCLVEDMLWG